MFKHSKYLIILALVIVSPLASAQPATFESSVLSIPQGAAKVGDQVTYYNNIQLISDIEGNFTLVAAEQRTLVAVDSVTVNIAESLPVQVSLTVSGNKSVPCVDLQAPAIFSDETSFTVVLAETSLGPAETCIAVIDPFETTISLDVSGLEAGTYTVSVNGVETSFSL